MGIGTTNPSTALQVVGGVTATSYTDGTATLSAGVLDLGTNTIYDGNFTGNWGFNTGSATGIGALSASGTVTFSGLTSDTDDSVLILNTSNEVRTREIDTRVWGTTLADTISASANYIPLFTDANTLTNSEI